MFDTVLCAGIPGMPAATLLQLFPPSRVTCTRPSLVPAQISPGLSGDSAIAKTTSAYSTPMLSGVRPPEICCLLSSYRATIPPTLPEPDALDQMMFGSVGSGVAQPLSPPATECHSPRGITPAPPPPPPPPNPHHLELDAPREGGRSGR